jgi:hypothetical protein
MPWSDEDVVRRWGRLFQRVAAGIADVPESSENTSITTRVEHVEVKGQTDRLEAAAHGSEAGSLAAGGLEESLWLCPIEDRRQLDSSREGMFDGLSILQIALSSAKPAAALTEALRADVSVVTVAG